MTKRKKLHYYLQPKFFGNKATKTIEITLNLIDHLPLSITEVYYDLLDHQFEYMERQIGVVKEYVAASVYAKEQKPHISLMSIERL